MTVSGMGLLIWILYNLISVSLNIDYYYLMTSWLGTIWNNIAAQLKNIFANRFHVGSVNWELIAVLGCILFFFLVIRSSSVIIPEEERYVIYRLGRFHKVIGPGWHLLLRGIETVENKINVRSEPHNFLIKGLYINGVPFSITINLWYIYNPVLIYRQDRNRRLLLEMAQFNNYERYEHVKVKLRDALVKSLSHTEKQYTPVGNSFIHKVLPVMPGIPESEEMLLRVKERLRWALLSIGVIVDIQYPIVITDIHFDESIVKGLSIGRVAMLLREQFPNLEDESILEYAAAIEKVNLGIRMQKTSTPSYTKVNEDDVVTAAASSPMSDKSIEQFAVAKIKDHEPGQPFIVGKTHTLITGIVGEELAGFELRKISLPRSDHELRVDIMVYAEDMDVKPHWLQSYIIDTKTQSPLMEFILQPKNSGHKVLRVDYLFQQNWLTKIEFDVDVVEQQESTYVFS